jgi:preprotein translocase SecF subunit
MFNIIEKRRWYFLLSGILMALSIAAVIVSIVQFGLPLQTSLDATEGSILGLEFDEAVNEDDIRTVFVARGLRGVIVQQRGAPEKYTWQVRTREITAGEFDGLLAALENQVGEIDRDAATLDSVQPVAGSEMMRTGGLTILVAALIVALFTWFFFRQLPHAFRYGVCAIAGILFNLLIVCGFYALMGIVGTWGMDAMFFIAVLAAIGFSGQSVIAVLDHIRENTSRHKTESYETVANRSILETLHPSLATLFCATFVMVAILLLGGQTTRLFVATILVGTLSATFFSIFVAVPLLVAWEKTARRRAAARVTT